MVHRFQFNGVDLKTTGSSIDQTLDFARSVLSDPTKTSLPIWYQALSKAEPTMDKIIFNPLEKHGLPIKALGKRSVKSFGW